MHYEDVMETTVKVFELVGVAVLVVGGFFAFGRYFLRLLTGAPRREAFDEVRASLGRAILLGLEVLVVADIIRTIVVTPTLVECRHVGRDRTGADPAELLDRRRGRRGAALAAWRAARAGAARLVVVGRLAARRHVVDQRLDEPGAVVAPPFAARRTRSTRRATTP